MPTYFYIRLKNSAAAKFRFVEIVFFGFIFETKMKTFPTSFSAAAIFLQLEQKLALFCFLNICRSLEREPEAEEESSAFECHRRS